MQGAQTNDEFTTDADGLATCQCIISHPEKPKFLAIRHSGGGYLPPQIRVPPDAVLGTNVPRVIEGVSSKYGLRTTLLRRLERFRDYQCIELEMHGSDGRPMQAIWVGLDDYRRMRGGELHPRDPLAVWLDQRQRGEVSPLRPPWERYGWYRNAAHWVDYQLDRLGIQATGSTQQWRALVHASTLLRTPTSSGVVWFKAAYAKPPREASLTAYLHRAWPDVVPQPLAIDESQNWMLMPDYAPGASTTAGTAELKHAAQALGELQAQSLAHLDPLSELGCESQGADRLAAFLGHPELAASVPELQTDSLTDEERAELAETALKLASLCEELGACGVPDLLVHPDFRFPNLFVRPDGVRVIDWENACIAPPSFSLLKLLREDRPEALDNLEDDPVVSAWLRPLETLAPASSWRRALALTLRLQHAWRLMRWSQEFSWFEPGSVAEANARRFVTRVVRDLLRAERQA